jgi:hypothetical protein
VHLLGRKARRTEFALAQLAGRVSAAQALDDAIINRGQPT